MCDFNTFNQELINIFIFLGIRDIVHVKCHLHKYRRYWFRASCVLLIEIVLTTNDIFWNDVYVDKDLSWHFYGVVYKCKYTIKYIWMQHTNGTWNHCLSSTFMFCGFNVMVIDRELMGVESTNIFYQMYGT